MVGQKKWLTHKDLNQLGISKKKDSNRLGLQKRVQLAKQLGYVK